MLKLFNASIIILFLLILHSNAQEHIVQNAGNAPPVRVSKQGIKALESDKKSISNFTEGQLFTLTHQKLEARDCEGAWDILWPMVGEGNYNAAYLLAIYAYLDILNPPLPIVKNENGKYIDHFITMLFYAQMSEGKNLNYYSEYYYKLDDIIDKYATIGFQFININSSACSNNYKFYNVNNLYTDIMWCKHDRYLNSFLWSGYNPTAVFTKSCINEFKSKNKIIDIKEYYKLFNYALKKSFNIKNLKSTCGNMKI